MAIVFVFNQLILIFSLLTRHRQGAGPAGWRRLAGLLLLAGLLGRASAARAQIVDDSTKVIYGPKTTRVIYEQEILRDSTEGTLIDTTLTRFPQARFWFHDSAFHQDLGAVGTAARPLLFRPNLELGARLGRNAFDRYARTSATVPYYDSRSPYSFFRVVQSGQGEQVFEISISRSLRKNFSIGAAYERIAANKILAARTSREGLVEHTNVLLFGRYQTDDERYHLVFNYNSARHDGIEQGGIWPLLGENKPGDLYNYRQQRVYLTEAKNTDDRDQLHFTHSYRLLGRGLTLFHTFDAQRQYNAFIDNALQPQGVDANQLPAVLYYPRVLRTPTRTRDQAEFRQVENTLGVLGRTRQVEYRLYARRRDAGITAKSLAANPTAANPNGDTLLVVPPGYKYGQVFVGGSASFTYRNKYAVEAAGEYKLFDEYWARAAARTGPLTVEILQSLYSPTLTQREFVGNHYEWHYVNSDGSATFRNTLTTQLSGQLRQALPFFADHVVELRAALVNINDLVYYGPSGTPEQAGEAKQLLTGFARHQVRFGRVGLDNQATYTRGGDVAGLRIPSLVTFSRAYYQSHIFNKALLSQVGLEFYYQSRYQPFDYSPSTQQFYLQDHFTSRNFGVANVFFAADIKTVNVFLKIAYVNQGLDYNGYFPTPYYTGYPRRFQLGVRWNFYN